MLAPISEYYTEEERAYALRMMRRAMETQRIIRQAQAIVSSKNQNIENYKMHIQEKATQTKESITQIKSQLDSAIKGVTADKINESVDSLLVGYDNII